MSNAKSLAEAGLNVSVAEATKESSSTEVFLNTTELVCLVVSV